MLAVKALLFYCHNALPHQFEALIAIEFNVFLLLFTHLYLSPRKFIHDNLPLLFLRKRLEPDDHLIAP